MDYKLRWSEESVNNLEKILKDIEEKWSLRAVEEFKNKLGHQLELIMKFPHIFPSSQLTPDLRKAVLSKQTTIFYKIVDDTIFLAYLHLNRKNIENIK